MRRAHLIVYHWRLSDGLYTPKLLHHTLLVLHGILNSARSRLLSDSPDGRPGDPDQAPMAMHNHHVSFLDQSSLCARILLCVTLCSGGINCIARPVLKHSSVDLKKLQNEQRPICGAQRHTFKTAVIQDMLGIVPIQTLLMQRRPAVIYGTDLYATDHCHHCQSPTKAIYLHCHMNRTCHRIRFGDLPILFKYEVHKDMFVSSLLNT